MPTWWVACDFSHVCSLWILWRGVWLSHALVFHIPKPAFYFWRWFKEIYSMFISKSKVFRNITIGRFISLQPFEKISGDKWHWVATVDEIECINKLNCQFYTHTNIYDSGFRQNLCVLLQHIENWKIWLYIKNVLLAWIYFRQRS